MEVAAVVIYIFIFCLAFIMLGVWWTARPRGFTDWCAGILGIVMLASIVWRLLS